MIGYGTAREPVKRQRGLAVFKRSDRCPDEVTATMTVQTRRGGASSDMRGV